MPDFGLKKALEEAVLQGAKGAKVARPAEKVLAEKEAEAAAREAAAKDAAATKTPEAAPATPAAEAPAAEVKPSKEQPTSKEAAKSEDAATPSINEEPSVPDKMPPREAPVDEIPATPKEPVTPEPVPADPVDTIAERVSKADLGDYAEVLGDTHMPNFDRISTGDDIKGVIAELATQSKNTIEAMRGPATSQAQLQAIAADYGLTAQAVKAALEREAGGVLTKEAIAGTRKFQVASAVRIKELGDKIAKGQATDIEKVQFARQVQLHNAVSAQLAGAKAEWGRTGHALQMPIAGDTAMASRITEILATSGADVNRLAKAVSMTSDVAGISKVVKQGLFRRAVGAAVNLINRNFVNGILSGPVTHFVNLMGNSIFQAMNVAELAVAARLGKFLPGEEHVMAGEALATLHGTLGATQDAWRLFGRALKTGQSLDGVLKVEATGGAYGSTLERLPELDKPYLGRLIAGLDTVIDLPTRVLGAEDDLFKTLAYRAYAERQAMRFVQDQMGVGALKLEDAAQAARNFMENAPDEVQKAAEDWAAEMTFQTPLGPAGQKFQSALRSVPVLTLVAPFVRTPTNIFKQSAYRSPLALFSSKFWADVSAGGAARDLALTRFAVGSATSALVAYWVTQGTISGGGPQNPKARQLWLENGNQPYSIKVTNPTTGETTWHSYARMEPFASIVGATADAVEIGSYVNEDPESLTDQESQRYQAAGAIIAGIMNNTGNKTFMKGISDFMELMNDPARNIKQYSSQMIASQVPFSALQRTIRNVDDPYLREAWTILDKIKDNTPGYSKGLPVRLDLFGEPREKNHSTLLGAMSPIPETTAKDDPVVAEMVDLMNVTHQVPSVMPDKRIEGMPLTASEYADFVRVSRAEPVFGGKSYYDMLEKTIRSAEYQKASPLLRVELLKHIQNQADKIGRVKLEKENPDYAERITQWRMDKERLLYNK